MPPISAGCLVTRDGPDGIEVLLVHAKGASFRQPLFGIPKGLVEPGESIEAAARRETFAHGRPGHARAKLSGHALP